MRHPSASRVEGRSRVGGRAPSALALALVASSLFLVDDAAATERARPLTEPAASSLDDEPVLARRRARQKRKKQQRPADAAPSAAPATPAPSAPSPAAEEAALDAATRRGPTRVEFDERLLQGQTNKANAIYLFQRRESALRSLVKKREHFHAEIDEALE